MSLRAIFFDVDFTLIHPGPTFQGEGYQRFCAAAGIAVDPARFEAATAAASSILDEVEDPVYDPGLFVHYTATIIEHMQPDPLDRRRDVARRSATLVNVATEIYEQWATNHHFEVYDDVAPVLGALAQRGFRLGAISNSHRCLTAFRNHFKLDELIAVAVSSAEHGYMKPHRSIFDAALERAGVHASEAAMVGDSLKADIEGARAAGMRGYLLRRSGERPAPLPADVTVIGSLHELLDHLPGSAHGDS